MQTILGAGGTIGSELAKELKKYTSDSYQEGVKKTLEL